MILRLLPLLTILHVALAYYTEHRPSYGEFSNSSIYHLPVDGDILIPDRTEFIWAVGNATAKANELAVMNRKNGRLAAANEPAELVLVCVGVAGTPARIRLFRDMKTCDQWGWQTLYVFQAYRNYNKFMAPEPMCVAHHNSPERSMIMQGKDCNKNGWTQDFVFWYNQCPWFADKCKGKDLFQHNSQIHVYEAHNPHRLMMAPGYDGAKYGWSYSFSFAYFAHYFVPNAAGFRFLRSQRNRYVKRQEPHFLAESYRRVVFERLISCWRGNYIPATPTGVLLDWNNCPAVRRAANGDFETFGSIQLFNMGESHGGEFHVPSVRVELRLQNRVWGAVHFPIGQPVGEYGIIVQLRNSLNVEWDLSVVVNDTTDHVDLNPTPGNIDFRNRIHPFLNPDLGYPMIYGGHPPGAY
ncbi:hypothetical protein CPB97_002350 [Podila verticillata]|nr:hypothetical protein CPB97_002350 [Podila verticillata]